jgi:hypothetical protein
MSKYNRVHRDIIRQRGEARGYRCVDDSCTKRALDWAFRWDLLEEEDIFRDEKHPYSLSLYDYDPMCRTCHKKLDAKDENSVTHFRKLSESMRGNTRMLGKKRPRQAMLMRGNQFAKGHEMSEENRILLSERMRENTFGARSWSEKQRTDRSELMKTLWTEERKAKHSESQKLKKPCECGRSFNAGNLVTHQRASGHGETP